MNRVPKNLPGADLVVSGIEALQRGEMTVEALLVAIGCDTSACGWFGDSPGGVAGSAGTRALQGPWCHTSWRYSLSLQQSHSPPRQL